MTCRSRSGLDLRTTLTRVQPHRLRALILADRERFPGCSGVDIHRRIGPHIHDIHDKVVTCAFRALVADGTAEPTAASVADIIG